MAQGLGRCPQGFDESGKPVARKVTSAETGKLLRAALDLEDEKPNKIRSHSLKVTMFGWAAKGGMDLPSRRILGHHLDPGAKAGRNLWQGLNLIGDSQDVSCSDSSTSGRFTNAADQDNHVQSEDDPSDSDSEVATADISEAPRGR